MNKQLHALALVTAMCSTSAFANGDGSVQFNGEVIDAACVVSTDTAHQLVKMGSVSTTAFNGINSTAAPTAFQIDLENCPASVANAGVKFDGAADQGDPNVLQLIRQPGTATGIGVRLRTSNNLLLPLYTVSPTIKLAQGVTNSLKFSAAYVATSDTVTPGPALAYVTFSVVYN